MRALLALVLATSSAWADEHLVLPAGEKSLRLQLAITVEGQSPSKAHQAFLDRLFDHFDRDGDGNLSAKESAGIFPLPAAEGRGLALDFAKLDANSDGKGSRAEFLDFYHKAGFTAVAPVFSLAGADLVKANAIVFQRLDRDADGRLSAVELANAPALMRSLDADEDEVLTIAEILDAPTFKEEAPKNNAPITWAALSNDKQADGVLTIGLSKAKSAQELKSVVDKAFETIADEVRYSGGTVRLKILDADPSDRLQATREFYLVPFKSALGNKPALDQKQIEDDSSLAFLSSVLPYADRDGDNRLTLAELERFLDLIDAGVRAQVVVRITDEGRSLFSLLDTNQDGRLDLSELSRASRLLAKGRENLAKDDIPRRVAVSIEQGPQGKTFGPVLLVGNRVAPTTKKSVSRVGPKWFQAMDQNSDGFLSPREFLGSPEVFKKLDADGDGLISVEEAARGENKK